MKACPAAGDVHGTKPAQTCWPEMGAQLQCSQPTPEAPFGKARSSVDVNGIAPSSRQQCIKMLTESENLKFLQIDRNKIHTLIDIFLFGFKNSILTAPLKEVRFGDDHPVV